MLIKHNMKHMNLRDEGGLIWPKMNTATLYGIVVTAFNKIIENSTFIKKLQSSTTPSRAGLKVVRDTVNIKINDHFIFHSKISICKKCKCDHLRLNHALTAAIFNTCTSNLIMILNRVENAKKLSLRMVEAAKKRQLHRCI